MIHDRLQTDFQGIRTLESTGRRLPVVSLAQSGDVGHVMLTVPCIQPEHQVQ
jgi:hypothetical protein